MKNYNELIRYGSSSSSGKTSKNDNEQMRRELLNILKLSDAGIVSAVKPQFHQGKAARKRTHEKRQAAITANYYEASQQRR